MYGNLHDMMKLTVFPKGSEPWPMFSYARGDQITTQVSRKEVLENYGWIFNAPSVSRITVIISRMGRSQIGVID